LRLSGMLNALKRRSWETKRALTALLCIGAFFAVFHVMDLAPVLPGLEETEALGHALGIWSLLPPLLAVALAFLTGDVILSLLVGVISGAALITAIEGGGIFYDTFHHTVVGILETSANYENVQVLILCVAVGGMEGVIRRSGGFEATARKLTRKINSPRKANLVSQLFCTLFFFDDYANALISGPVLTPVTDKAGVSREKLSYIVDSTAAPLAGIAVISSWVAVEVSVIQEGLDAIGSNASAFHIFFNSIPYCFYCIFAIVFIILLTITGREYGPMLQAERRARAGHPVKKGTQVVTDRPEELPGYNHTDRQWRRILLAFGSVLLMLIFDLAAFYITGRATAIETGLIAPEAGFSFANLSTIIGCADTIQIVMEGAFLAGFAALVLGVCMNLFSLHDGILAWVDGAISLMPTIIVLILAWTLSDCVSQLGSVYFVVDAISAGIPKLLVPTLIFLTCCLVSFATGSYGCMFMVMPMAVPIVAAVGGIAADPSADPFMLACVAAVLSGSIFGDHCSPMTDCTILAALGAGCETMDHVKTQMPYALTVAITTVVCGTLLTSLTGIPVWAALLVGIVLMAAVVRFVGKKV